MKITKNCRKVLNLRLYACIILMSSLLFLCDLNKNVGWVVVVTVLEILLKLLLPMLLMLPTLLAKESFESLEFVSGEVLFLCEYCFICFFRYLSPKKKKELTKAGKNITR